MNYGMLPDYHYDKSTFDVEDANLPKYTPPTHPPARPARPPARPPAHPPAHPPALTVQTSNLVRPDHHRRESGHDTNATQRPPPIRRPTSRGRPLPPTPGGPRPMHQLPQTPVAQALPPLPAPHRPPPLPVAIPSSPPQFSSMSMSPLTPALTGSSASSYSNSIRSPPLPRPSLPPVSESMFNLAPKIPGHTCAGRGLDIVFYRGDATALPMYGRGDRIEGHIDLKNTKDVCQIEITVRLLSGHLPSLIPRIGQLNLSRLASVLLFSWHPFTH
jgi:hypothetical protein